MPARSPLRAWLGNLQRRASHQPQRYRFTYRVAVPDTGGSAAAVVCPLPLSTGYQEVTDLHLDPPPSRRERDSRFGNPYAQWELPLRGAVDHVAVAAVVAVRPRQGPDRPYPAAGAAARASPDRYIKVTDRVRQLCGQLAAAGDPSPEQYLRRCYEYVVGHLSYGRPIDGLYSVDDALRLAAVDCGGFVTLLASLLLARGFSARLVAGFLARPSAGMHAWLEAQLPDSSWLPLDPSVDHLRRHGRSSRVGGYGFVGSDRVVCSVGSDLPLAFPGQTVNVPLLQHAVLLAARSATLVRAEVDIQRL